MYPGLAYQKARRLMVEAIFDFWDLYEGDKFKIGFNAHAPWQIIYEEDGNWSPTIRLDEDDEKMKYFWEMHYEAIPCPGCYLTFKKGDNWFTRFHGSYCYAKIHYFEFMPVFMIQHDGVER